MIVDSSRSGGKKKKRKKVDDPEEEDEDAEENDEVKVNETATKHNPKKRKRYVSTVFCDCCSLSHGLMKHCSKTNVNAEADADAERDADADAEENDIEGEDDADEDNEEVEEDDEEVEDDAVVDVNDEYGTIDRVIEFKWGRRAFLVKWSKKKKPLEEPAINVIEDLPKVTLPMIWEKCRSNPRVSTWINTLEKMKEIVEGWDGIERLAFQKGWVGSFEVPAAAGGDCGESPFDPAESPRSPMKPPRCVATGKKLDATRSVTWKRVWQQRRVCQKWCARNGMTGRIWIFRPMLQLWILVVIDVGLILVRMDIE